jgi:hypothetical protein
MHKALGSISLSLPKWGLGGGEGLREEMKKGERKREREKEKERAT